MDELQGYLPSVRVSSQAQVNAQFGGAVKRVGVMAEKNIGRLYVSQMCCTLRLPPLPYLWQQCDNPYMKQGSVRTTVDIPAPLYRKLKEQAAAKGSSVRELVLSGVKSVLLQGQRPRPRRV